MPCTGPSGSEVMLGSSICGAAPTFGGYFPHSLGRYHQFAISGCSPPAASSIGRQCGTCWSQRMSSSEVDRPVALQSAADRFSTLVSFDRPNPTGRNQSDAANHGSRVHRARRWRQDDPSGDTATLTSQPDPADHDDPPRSRPTQFHQCPQGDVDGCRPGTTGPARGLGRWLSLDA